MIVAVGDLHGAPEHFMRPIIKRACSRPAAIVQVGDLDWRPSGGPLFRPPRYEWPMYWCEGNHDELPDLLRHSRPTEVAPGVTYCPRGSVVEIDGRRLGFLGGARSIDRKLRVRGETWWEEEELTWEEGQRLLDQPLRIDVLVTHCPPISVMQPMLPGLMNDRTATVVEDVWRALGEPRLLCGHMHRRYHHGPVLVLGLRDVEAL